MKDQGKVGVRELYVEVTNNLRFGKQQQWVLSHYLLLFYGATYWAHSILRDFVARTNSECGEWIDRFALVLTASAAVWGMKFMHSYLDFLRRNRRRLNNIYCGHIDKRFQEANKGTEKHFKGNRVSECLFRDWEIWLPQVIVQLVAAAWLAIAIWNAG